MTDVLDSFIDKKKDESTFVGLTDGESAKVLCLREIKLVTKLGFGGEEKEVLRLVVDVETGSGIRTKNFDNGTAKFAKEMQDKGVKLGSSFVITRIGLQTKTRYVLSDVAVGQAAPAPAPVSPAPSTIQSVPEAIAVEDIPM